MSKRDDWIDYFELLHGRKPNADEYLEAKNAGKFDSSPDNTDQSVTMGLHQNTCMSKQT